MNGEIGGRRRESSGRIGARVESIALERAVVRETGVFSGNTVVLWKASVENVVMKSHVVGLGLVALLRDGEIIGDRRLDFASDRSVACPEEYSWRRVVCIARSIWYPQRVARPS